MSLVKIQTNTHLPKRIILVRHGESSGNADRNVRGTTPTHKFELTEKGIEQAKQTGIRIKKLISENDNNWKVFFYVSPLERTRKTLREIGGSFPTRRVMGVKEEPRLRDLNFGNYHDPASIGKIQKERFTYGRFYYRVPGGETGAEVYDRISGYIECLRRDIEMKKFVCHDPCQETNIIIITHGLSSRIFLMKWFDWTVEQFEVLNRMRTGEFQVLQLGHGGEYSLAFHHDDKKLREWGLSPDMIEDQKCKAYGPTGVKWQGTCDSYPFMDCFAEDSDDENTLSKL
ncbi:phosphoglycerate mutase-like protein AT74 isoform X1 [Solanum tuberosum]|uniref:Phosphoglycerate/bisphosphoglycerate mutase family protein n=1 Tax=Solanum tuberosum TaxID=4113 RepID=M1CS77_SOLTU|nr:PREDICTED: phosphoglycerate mutase-like protein AT74 isoform X1 [Solanum tuberosum]